MSKMKELGRWMTMAVLVITGCAGTNREIVRELSASDEQIRWDMQALWEKLDSLSVQRDIEDLKARLQTLEVERHKGISDLAKQNTDMENELAVLKDRLERMERNIKKPLPRPSQTPGRPALFRPDSYDVKASYQQALQNYREGRFNQAIGEFSEILSIAPESDLADNAQYWIGECYYGLGNYRQALVEFRNVLAYHKTDKDDDAQLKIGYCYWKLEEHDEALVELERLLVDYPDSEYKGKASSVIEKIRGQ